ncbi:hypothetical protein HZH68_001722 [Vespula germanica]|uniref:Uncharacterized protein n=1 Tax=Vespula germanica TaxID=30212 RepID=A0A834NW64_VESGE|nr:hypothetical protein HZH68_001722 [Vespula germanica]
MSALNRQTKFSIRLWSWGTLKVNNEIYNRHKRFVPFYGDNALAARTARKLLGNFRNFNLEDREYSKRTSNTVHDQTKTLIERITDIKVLEISEILNLSKATVHEHLAMLN